MEEYSNNNYQTVSPAPVGQAPALAVSPKKKTLKKVFFAVVALAVLVFLIVYLQKMMVSVGGDGLSASERAKIISDLNKASANTPPLTTSERTKIISDLNKASAKAPPLSAEDRASIIKSLSK